MPGRCFYGKFENILSTQTLNFPRSTGRFQLRTGQRWATHGTEFSCGQDRVVLRTGSSSFSLWDEFLLSTAGVRKTTVQSHETAMQSRKTTAQSHETAMQFPKYDATDRRTSPKEEAPFCQDEKFRSCRRGRDRLDRCFPKPGRKCVTARHEHRGNHLYHPLLDLN